MKVGFVQIACTAYVEANKLKLAEKIRLAARQGAQLVVIQH